MSGGEPIASAITKKINDEKTSKLILVANSMFASDWYVTLNSSSGNSSQVVAINFYNNRDLVINSVSYLTDREDNITIRKDTGVARAAAHAPGGYGIRPYRRGRRPRRPADVHRDRKSVV